MQEQDKNEWLLGDPFFFSYYSVYDYDTKRIGLVGPNISYEPCSFMCNLSSKQEYYMQLCLKILLGIICFSILFFVYNKVLNKHFANKKKKIDEKKKVEDKTPDV